MGGFGGYAAPLNPIINPFNTLGDYRNVFRSLQYARGDMFLCARPRHIIASASIHVESLIKLLLAKYKIIPYVSNYRQFGKNVSDLYRKNIINKTLFDRLNFFRGVLNYAKHGIDPKENITFDYEDAIIFYFESRIVGNQLLQLLNHETCNKIYEIVE